MPGAAQTPETIMLEHHSKPLLPRPDFIRRLLRSIAAAMGLVITCLLIGMAGYHGFEGLTWVDSFANASMILSGMGPLNPMVTTCGKIFAGCYALFSGLALVTIIATIGAPVFHRFLHKFHIEDAD
jgi:hypothetical protein